MKRPRQHHLSALLAALVVFWPSLALLWSAPTARAADSLEKGFQQPPAAARPWVYWFWLNGNITREGITADLEAMKRVGIGGVLIMEVDQGAPVGPVDFVSPKWRELFKHVTAESQRLGLEVNMNNDAGWNGSGGPWIKPEQSMQKVVWSEVDLEGPKHFEGAIAQPQAVANFYRDISVLAFPATGKFRIDNIDVKACYKVGGAGPASDKKLPTEMVIDRARIVDLSSKMDKTGRLAWDVPEGKWTIVRFGHTSTGAVNAPAPASGRGLECDKLSKEGIEANFAGMMAKLIDDVGPAAGKTLVTTHIDSWENGAQNWTARMREEFKKRRGYDLLPFLPTLMGRVVDRFEISERFLWDLRQTVSDLVVENYAGHLQTLAHQHGMKLSIEAYGGPCDDLPYAGRADEPMCEFWIGGFMYETCKEMASAAHIYGKTILGAEAFTATDSEKWREHPGSIKSLGDQAFCAGVNRFVFHRYAMQPWLDRRPGMTMGPWGLHYERTNTWWEDSAPWHEYLARCQFLLRQGLFVADLCYLQPEASPQGYYGHPRGAYEFDNCSAEALLTRMSVKDGRLTLPDGMSYRLLVLPEVRTMNPGLVRRIRDLVRAGATVLGPRPQKSPGLAGYPECDEKVKQLADELWGDCDGKAVKEHRLGKGRVAWGLTPEQLLERDGVRPDFASRTRLNYIHRSVAGTEIYFVANPDPINVEAVCKFRVSGKRPELWWPETGRRELASVFHEQNGVTSVSLQLEASGSVFVVFREGGEKIDPIVEVTRDGKPVLSATDSGPRIVVSKAIYGVPGDAQKTRDVREKVQQLVDHGDIRIQVSRLAEGDDPAVNIVKTLVIDYTVGDRKGSVTGRDSDTVTLTSDNHNHTIVVNKATYGVPNDAKRSRDVKQKLQDMIDKGMREFQVAQLAAGDDPADGIVKTLVLDYTVNGKPFSGTGTDPEMIRLSLREASERVAELRRAPDGKVSLEARQPGRYVAKTAGNKTIDLDVSAMPAPFEIHGPWQVRFAPGWGAPQEITLDELTSWSHHSDAGVKHFSGAATYHKTFSLLADTIRKNHHLYLDLGRVEVLAQVKLNGRDLGLLWKAPYRVDLSGAAKAGENALEIRVVNQWINRMIGDEQLPDDSARNPDGTLKSWPEWLRGDTPSPTGRLTFTSWRLWKKGDALLDSGLIGPVQIISTTIIELK